MREEIYRGTVEHNFIRRSGPLIIISREIGLIGLVIWNTICTFSHNSSFEQGESSFLQLRVGLNMFYYYYKKSYLSIIFYEICSL